MSFLIWLSNKKKDFIWVFSLHGVQCQAAMKRAACQDVSGSDYSLYQLFILSHCVTAAAAAAAEWLFWDQPFPSSDAK